MWPGRIEFFFLSGFTQALSVSFTKCRKLLRWKLSVEKRFQGLQSEVDSLVVFYTDLFNIHRGCALFSFFALFWVLITGLKNVKNLRRRSVLRHYTPFLFLQYFWALHQCLVDKRNIKKRMFVEVVIDTWLILPVVICSSQRLSHACLSISNLYCETANGSLNQLSFI